MTDPDRDSEIPLAIALLIVVGIVFGCCVGAGREILSLIWR